MNFEQFYRMLPDVQFSVQNINSVIPKFYFWSKYHFLLSKTDLIYKFCILIFIFEHSYPCLFFLDLFLAIIKIGVLTILLNIWICIFFSDTYFIFRETNGKNSFGAKLIPPVWCEIYKFVHFIFFLYLIMIG